LRVVFAGTPAFAARSLEALLEAGHNVPLVLTQPDRRAGRGLKLTPSPVAILAQLRRLPIAKPSSLNSKDSQSVISEACPDVMVVAAYGLILPRSVLTIPAKGCLNIHASLLPRWRGAAPIQRAILAGDSETGVGIMVMEEGLDTGPVILQRTVPILGADTTGTLTEKLASEGALAIVEALDTADRWSPLPQDASRATYAAKIEKSEARIDWNRTAAEIHRQIRAFDPFPGSETRLGGEMLKIWAARPVEASGDPGTVVDVRDGCPVVACGTGALELTLLQRPGSRRMAASDFRRGSAILLGTRLGAPA
jgi:methionyl-tRNA formyltransferase